LDSFEEEFKDKQIASLHHKHHQKTRQKNLLRIAKRLEHLHFQNTPN